MDTHLKNLIDDYQVAVAQAVAALEDHQICERPLSRTNWVSNGMDTKGVLGAQGSYFKRGYGCVVDYQGLTIDFEFGEQGQTDGFDPAKLWSFLDLNGKKNPLGSETMLNDVFSLALREKSIAGSPSTLYYLKHSEDLTR